MADLGISEFTFGYAFVSEQIMNNWGNIVSVPIFPSLIKERKLGYDVKLPLKGKTFYYQFKTSELFRSKNSKYIKDGTYSGSYYRIKLHKMFNNNQHRMLWSLSQTERDTYYVAPECTDFLAFNNAFLHSKVTHCSRLIPLINCINYASSDSDQHYITYTKGSSAFYQHSETSEKKESILGKDMRDLYVRRVNDFERIDDKFINKIISTVRKLSEDYVEYEVFFHYYFDYLLDKAEEAYDKLSLTAKFLWASHGILMTIIGEETKEEGNANEL